MDFKNHIDSIFEPKTIFEFEIDDFIKEEIEVIKVYCEKFLKNLQYLHHSLRTLKIPKPKKLEINDQLKIGLERLEKKDLTINNGLRLKTYIYYEKFIEHKLNYIILLCKLLNYIEEYHKKHIGDPFDDTFFNLIPIRPDYKANFLLALLEDLDLIYRSTDLLAGTIVTIDLTSKGREIFSSFCPYWNFKTLLKLANDTKESFLFEPYNNNRVRIVAYNPNGINKPSEYYGINEILYFRIDFTDADLEQKEPIFSKHNRIGLFEEILSFNDLENKLEINPFLIYNFNNYILEFVYSVPPYFFNKKFKEKIRGNFDYARILCADLINFIFFDHLDQYHDMKFSHRDFENIEFQGEGGSLIDITDKVNNFMGINLNVLDQPNFTIVFPVKSFQFPEPKFEEIEGKKYIEFKWDVDEQYLTSFRCKTLINGNRYDVPSEGLRKEIINLNQGEFVIKIQWCGDPELCPLDNELNRVEYKNPFYQSVKLEYLDLEDEKIKKKYFNFLKTQKSFIKEIGPKKYSIIQEKIEKLKEKCGKEITAKDCEECWKYPNKICLTKLFSFPLGKEVLPHCAEELADCYWISENEGKAIVLKATNLNTQNQYNNASIQVNKLTQRNTVKIIFFANNKPTSHNFISEALNLCKATNKRFIPFNKDDLIQFLYFYEITYKPKEKIEEI